MKTLAAAAIGFFFALAFYVAGVMEETGERNPLRVVAEMLE